VFEKSGCRVHEVRMVERDGSFKGFAYVELSDADSLQRALSEMQGQMHLGRPLKLDVADGRKHKSGDYRGGRGGGYHRGGGRGGQRDYQDSPEYASFSSNRKRASYDSPDHRPRASTGDPRRDEAQMSGDLLSHDTPSAPDRPKLQLKPRSSDAAASTQPAAPSSIFGDARPRDEREYLEQKKQREKKEEEERKRKELIAQQQHKEKEELETKLKEQQAGGSEQVQDQGGGTLEQAQSDKPQSNIKESPSRGGGERARPTKKYVAVEKAARKKSIEDENQKLPPDDGTTAEGTTAEEPAEMEASPPPVENTTSHKRSGRRNSKGDKSDKPSNGAKSKHTDESARIVLDPGAALADKAKPSKGRGRGSESRGSSEKEGRGRGRGRARGRGDARGRGSSPATKSKPEAKAEDDETRNSKRSNRKFAKATPPEPPKPKTPEASNSFALLDPDEDD